MQRVLRSKVAIAALIDVVKVPDVITTTAFSCVVVVFIFVVIVVMVRTIQNTIQNQVFYRILFVVLVILTVTFFTFSFLSSHCRLYPRVEEVEVIVSNGEGLPIPISTARERTRDRGTMMHRPTSTKVLWESEVPKRIQSTMTNCSASSTHVNMRDCSIVIRTASKCTTHSFTCRGFWARQSFILARAASLAFLITLVWCQVLQLLL